MVQPTGQRCRRLHLTSTSSLAVRYIKQRALERESAASGTCSEGKPGDLWLQFYPRRHGRECRLQTQESVPTGTFLHVIGWRFNLSNIKSHNRRNGVWKMKGGVGNKDINEETKGRKWKTEEWQRKEIKKTKYGGRKRMRLGKVKLSLLLIE